MATVGEALVSTGIGFWRLTTATANPRASWRLTTFTSTLAAGGAAGAVYSPVASMVPTIAFPPGISFTNQSTVDTEVFETYALNFTVAPPRTVVEVGDIVTFTGALTVRPRVLLGEAPGSGFETITSIELPAGFSATADTSSSVALRNRGTAGLPSSVTVLEGRKFVPRIRNV